MFNLPRSLWSTWNISLCTIASRWRQVPSWVIKNRTHFLQLSDSLISWYSQQFCLRFSSACTWESHDIVKKSKTRTTQLQTLQVPLFRVAALSKWTAYHEVGCDLQNLKPALLIVRNRNCEADYYKISCLSKKTKSLNDSASLPYWPKEYF
jgi:hypothetical protein